MSFTEEVALAVMLLSFLTLLLLLMGGDREE